jgi:NitT/TauT family transport system substrate-binding protein
MPRRCICAASLDRLGKEEEMVTIIGRRSAMTVVAGAAAQFVLPRMACAASRPGTAVYPIAVPIYQAQFVASGKGFFSDAGLDCKVIQGGSGVKAREIVASGNADIGIGDITHPMQLSNHGRSARVLMPVDTRNIALVFVIRKDLYDQGIDTLQKLAAWKRPDGRKPILGVSSLGGTTHIWATYIFGKINIDQAVTWIGAGDVETMLGSIKTKQIDVLAAAPSLKEDAVAHGWGALLFDGSSEDNWNKYIGGKVPATAHFALKATIDNDPPKMQAYVTALWRATQWIKTHSPDEIYAAIEPFVGSTARQSNLYDIKLMQDVTDYTGMIDKDSYERGAKVWFTEITGIRPIPMDQIIDSTFVQAAKKTYPG